MSKFTVNKFSISCPTFVIAADHRVSVESWELPVNAEAEAVLGPLESPGLPDDSAGQSHSAPDDSRLVLGLHRETLFPRSGGKTTRQ